MLFEQSPLNHLPVNKTLSCSEEWLQRGSDIDDEDVEPYRFHVTLPVTVASGRKLTFYSRERSSGTGILSPDEEMTGLETVYDGPMDPHFFERGFYLEAKTGFAIWPGSRLMLQALLCNLDDAQVKVDRSAFGRLKYWQNRLMKSSTPLKILEVGAGIGVVGTSLAAAGGHVLMTDLNVLVEHGMGPNLARNQNVDPERDIREETSPSPFLSSVHLSEQNVEVASKPVSVGCGYVRPTVLDWFKPVSSQLSSDAYKHVDLIVAPDCIFLRKLCDPLFDTVSQIFCNANKSEEVTCLFTYQRRNLMGVFIPLEEVLDKIAQRGWGVQCLAWRKVVVEDDGEHELYLFEISGRGSKSSNTASADGEEKKD